MARSDHGELISQCFFQPAAQLTPCHTTAVHRLRNRSGRSLNAERNGGSTAPLKCWLTTGTVLPCLRFRPVDVYGHVALPHGPGWAQCFIRASLLTTARCV